MSNQLQVMLAYIFYPECQTEYVHRYFGVPWTEICQHCHNCTSIDQSQHFDVKKNQIQKKCTALPLITQKWLNQIKPNSEQLHLIPGIGQGWLEKLQLPE
jgi:superfamily II DNA helicase RecQ